MRIELFKKDSHYETLTTFWQDREHLVIPKEYLSDYGFMAFDEQGNPVAAMWLYPVVSTNWCMVRFPISNPDVPNEIRSKAMDLIFDTIHKVSKDMGFNQIFCTTNHKGLIKRLTKYGYTLDSSDCVHFWGGL